MSAGTTCSGRDPRSGAGIVVRIDGTGRIAEVGSGPAEGPWLAAGLVDLQVNGFAGLDINEGILAPRTVAALCPRLAAEGVTRFLPTVITASRPEMLQRIAAIAEAVATDPLAGAMIAGIHVEGPFVSAEDGPRGAHPLAQVRPADPAEIDDWRRAARGLLRIVTLAPEVPGAVAAIRAAVGAGIRVAIGHSAATGEQITAAVDAGATLSTHLGNGIAATLPRHPNPIWSQLAEDRLTATFICDGHHLPAETARAMIRAKGPGRAVLVSDSVSLAGMPPGRYRTGIGGEVEVAANGRVSLAGTPFLAGAGHSLRVMTARAVRMTGLPLAEALAMASGHAAAAVGLPGGLVPGARADLIRFDWAPGDDALAIRDTVVAGERVAP